MAAITPVVQLDTILRLYILIAGTAALKHASDPKARTKNSTRQSLILAARCHFC